MNPTPLDQFRAFLNGSLSRHDLEFWLVEADHEPASDLDPQLGGLVIGPDGDELVSKVLSSALAAIDQGVDSARVAKLVPLLIHSEMLARFAETLADERTTPADFEAFVARRFDEPLKSRLQSLSTSDIQTVSSYLARGGYSELADVFAPRTPSSDTT